jgi:integrase
VAEKLAREWVAREERTLAGLIVDPMEVETADTPLSTLLDEFLGSLNFRGLEPDYVRKPAQRCRDLFTVLGWRRVADATPLDLRRYLESSRWSASTRNHYLDAVMQFYRWLQRDGRIPRNSIGDVPRFKVAFTETDDRAAFTEDELRRLIDPETDDARRLYRADVYALMVFSGLRWVEASQLQVRDIRRDNDGYSILIPRGKDKSNRGDMIELPDELAPVIGRLIEGRTPTARLLRDGCPTRHTFSRDCERAGIERVRGDGSRIVRYSSRDTYTSLLRARARSTDQVRALTRHTTRGMEDRYTDRKTQGLCTLVNAMPVVVPSRTGADHFEPAACVHRSVNIPTQAAASTILRGIDSPRLHSQHAASCPVPAAPAPHPAAVR